ncbi:MAG: DUF6057 family protein [Planctomycetota bacterium]|nr:DUF6057 family protein [Planctomycetota bacterium]
MRRFSRDIGAALVLAGLLWVLLISTIGFMNAVGRGRVSGTWIVPGVLLLPLYSQYQFPTSAIVGVALTMAAANAWLRTPTRRIAWRTAFFVVLCTALYYVTGVVGGGVFVACCVIGEILVERRWLLGLVLLGVATGVKFGVDWALLHIGLAWPHSPGFYPNLPAPGLPDWPILALYAYFPVCELAVIGRRKAKSLAMGVWQRLRGSEKRQSPPAPGLPDKQRRKDTPDQAPAQPAAVASSGRALGWIGWAASLVLLYGAAATGYYTIDRDVRTSLEIEYCAEHQLWPEVLAKAKTLPLRLYSPSINYGVNLALYQTGCLPSAMFAYPQVCEPVPLAGATGLLNRLCELLIGLGRVNNAEHAAHEMLEIAPTGKALKHLALVKLVKGETDAARVVLNVLEDDLVWGEWAR